MVAILQVQCRVIQRSANDVPHMQWQYVAVPDLAVEVFYPPHVHPTQVGVSVNCRVRADEILCPFDEFSHLGLILEPECRVGEGQGEGQGEGKGKGKGEGQGRGRGR